ncbi:ABC transporter permease [archaeon]|jgi:putative ABC transport system permease protein|nr:ABC transporter permease [archaeon]MBT6606084.1 ABC transporter permease [archaeon]MBT7252076.1 ABC transporter permease [archaeon]MBT7660975.1 ABC transporter permease [archaeon]
MKDYFDLAFGNLKHRGVRSWLTLLGIFIGIAAVVSLISLGSGLKLAVNSQFGVSTTEVITVQAGGVTAFGPPGSGAANPLDVDDMEAIEKLASVERVLRRNIPSGSLEFNDHLIFGLMMNIPDGEDRKFAYETLDVEAEFGRLLKDGDVNKVVLGSNFLEDKVGLEKKVKVGDKILLQEKTFEVVGITKKKGSFIFDNIVHVNEKPLEDLMGYGDDVDVIVVQVKNKDLMEKTKADIEKVLRKTRDVKLGEEDFEVSTPEAALETVNGIISGVQAFIVIIASLSILVGALGIVNTMTASVLERKKEIGIMKAIGARNSDVFMQFFIESGLLGLVGGIIGVVVGTLVGFLGTQGINSFIGSETIPEISLWLIFGSLVGSFVIGAVSGIVPAMNAAKENPVEALRG